MALFINIIIIIIIIIIAALSTEYMSALKSQPQLMKNLLNYHIVKGKITSDEMVGQQNFTSKIAVKIKVNVFRNVSCNFFGYNKEICIYWLLYTSRYASNKKKTVIFLFAL